MKPILTLFVAVFSFGFCAAQEEFTQSLPAFDKLIVSPRINVVLQKGDEESIRISYSNIDRHNINVKIRRGKLHLYLEHAKVIQRQEKIQEGNCSFKRDMYRDASVTAYITYKELNSLQVRGEEEVTIDDSITSDKFKLKVYGGADVLFTSLTANKFKAKMYGENYLRISSGEIKDQKYKLYGENKIDTRAIESQTITSTIYGEGMMRVKASDEMILTSFGDPSIQLSGNAHLHRGIVIGNPRIRSGVDH